jgi:hypothetical protein
VTLFLFKPRETEKRTRPATRCNVNMLFSAVLSVLPLLGLSFAQQLEPNYTSSSGVKIYNPSNFFTTTGPWSLMSHAGDTLYIAGPSLNRILHLRAPSFADLSKSRHAWNFPVQ